MLRKQVWPRLLRTLPDYLKDTPLVFLGTEVVVPHVRELLSALRAMPKPNVSQVVFLKDDETLNDPTVLALSTEIGLLVVDATTRELASGIAALKPKQGRLELVSAPADGGDRLTSTIEPFKTLVATVPRDLPEGFEAGRHLVPLTDSLFRPTSVDWLPFLCELDLIRSFRQELSAEVVAALQTANVGYRPYIVLRGEAGVGKTTALKRLACDLAGEGVTTLWCRRSVAGNWLKQYRQLAAALGKVIRKSGTSDKKIVVICDDPWGLRLDAGELLSCFDGVPAKIAFVFAFRNSDYYTGDGPSLSLPLRPYAEIEAPFELDGEELSELGTMLVKIGAAKDQKEADEAVSRVPSEKANDILCSLLVPSSGNAITVSGFSS